MKLEQLYYFQEAVKYRSISVAAKQNYISQSSFSGAISRLEQELGAPLLTRTNTGVEPTELGRLALEKAEAIFQAQSELVAAAKGQNVAGTVALQCIPGFHHRVLTAVLQTLRSRCVELKLHPAADGAEEAVSEAAEFREYAHSALFDIPPMSISFFEKKAPL